MARPQRPLVLIVLLVGALACDRGVAATDGPDTEWVSYGGDPGGLRYADVADITADNAHRLQQVWIHHTGDTPDRAPEMPSTIAFEATPLLVDRTLFVCTPYNRVLALDPETGATRWSFDPEVDLTGDYANQMVCRGVAQWLDPASPPTCARRILTATNDARLFALDAATGVPCPDFGVRGVVDLNPGVGEQWWRGEYQVTSPPAIAGDLAIVGSAVSDNVRTTAPSGVVRAYDVRSGELRWAWDLRSPDFEPNEKNTSEAGYALGTPNVWAPMAVDAERDLLFVPTGNPAPDYFRGEDSSVDHFGSSVVALRASTGEVVWRFQTVHRDLWDFDVPAQPTLFELERDGETIPALVQATKMGFLFVLHRETGEPLFPVEERPVPQIHVAGEHLSPTQPFPTAPPGLVRQQLDPDDAWGVTPWDRGACRNAIAALRFEGMFTPPTLEGSLMVPGNAGGSNWGGVAVHPERRIAIANTQDLPWTVRLLPREQYDAEKAKGGEVAPQHGTPFAVRRSLLLSPLGLPCSPPPWGTLAAVDLARGAILWQVPLGTIRDIGPIPLPPISVGIPNLGGPLVTSGGLVFIGAALDKYLRAVDLETGEEVWRHRLPWFANATPMTYRQSGRQYVVVAAGGYGRAGDFEVGDAIVAFALE